VVSFFYYCYTIGKMLKSKCQDIGSNNGLHYTHSKLLRLTSQLPPSSGFNRGELHYSIFRLSQLKELPFENMTMWHIISKLFIYCWSYQLVYYKKIKDCANWNLFFLLTQSFIFKLIIFISKNYNPIARISLNQIVTNTLAWNKNWNWLSSEVILSQPYFAGLE